MINLQSILVKIKNKLVKIVNTTRIPRLVDFIFKPTLKDALDAAPPASQNWVRLGLDKISSTGLPVWIILLLPVVMIAFKWGSEALQFFIQIISQGFMLIPLGIIVYFIFKNFKK